MTNIAVVLAGKVESDCTNTHSSNIRIVMRSELSTAQNAMYQSVSGLFTFECSRQPAAGEIDEYGTKQVARMRMVLALISLVA